MVNNIIEKYLLVIDDEVDITKSLYRQLRRKYKVLTATSGSDALKIMETNPVQVILSDQRMPEMTGVDFFSKIKDQYPDALKLILTGYSDIEAVVDAINEGQVFRYLTKPWNPVELELALKEAFEKHELIIYNKKLLNQLQEANANLEEKVKQRTNELELVNERLKTLNKEKNKYIGIVTHELRNPIGNIYNISELLISGFETYAVDKQLEFLELIYERSLYSLKLINSFLDSSKIESGILDLSFKEYDYLQIVENCIKQNEEFACNKSQNIEFEYSPDSVPILCDKDKIEQVLNNLISNAIKYSEQHKTIWVKVAKDSLGIVTSVIDEGKGIAEDELKNVFNAYQTTSTTSTANEKSTGLGLAIAKKIVESHSGTITASSEIGKGSMFQFELPVNA
jgi:signal transduction histidine kinase